MKGKSQQSKNEPKLSIKYDEDTKSYVVLWTVDLILWMLLDYYIKLKPWLIMIVLIFKNIQISQFFSHQF